MDGEHMVESLASFTRLSERGEKYSGGGAPQP